VNADSALFPLLESALNRLLKLDSATIQRLSELQGKVIRINTPGADRLELWVLPQASGLQIAHHLDRDPDVTLTADLDVFLRLAARRVAPEVSPSGEVQIRGDILLGQQFQRLLEQVDIDWEELMARVVGDIPAHQLGNLLRGLGNWSRQAADTIKLDIEEYLLEESRLLPERERAAVFRSSVERLAQDLDALERRLGPLEKRIR